MAGTEELSVYIRASSAPGSARLGLADVAETRTVLEEGPDGARITALHGLVVAGANGERQLLEALLMPLIRFVLPRRDKTLKRLLLLLFENMDKTDAEGALRQEFILVCNAWRNDLHHANEYVRGATLRFLCRVREPELLEPLVPSVRACLEHPHAHVRRCAIHAVHCIHRHAPALLPDAPELLEQLLRPGAEPDAGAQRAAFTALDALDAPRAARHLAALGDALATCDEPLQLAAIAHLRHAHDHVRDHVHEQQRARALLLLLRRSGSAAARFGSAVALLALAAPAAAHVRAAVDALVALATREPEGGVKLVVLARLLDAVLPRWPAALQAAVPGLLRVLAAPDAPVRRLCLRLLAASTTSRSAPDVVRVLRRELRAPHVAPDYRRDLLDALHACAQRFADVAPDAMNAYLDLLQDATALDAPPLPPPKDSPAPPPPLPADNLVPYIKEALFQYPRLRHVYLSAVTAALPRVAEPRALRNLLWAVGEFCVDPPSITAAIHAVATCVGDLPMLAAEERRCALALATDPGTEHVTAAPATPMAPRAPRILADGTYASQSALTADAPPGHAPAPPGTHVPSIRRLLLEGRFECCGALANALAKLHIRLQQHQHHDPTALDPQLHARVVLILTGLLRLGTSPHAATPMDADSIDRIALALQLVLAPPGTDEDLKRAFTVDSEDAFNRVLRRGLRHRHHGTPGDSAPPPIHAPIAFFPTAPAPLASPPLADALLALTCDAPPATLPPLHPSATPAKLSRVVQLTGFSDPIYAETYVHVAQKEIQLDLLLVNQTDDTLQAVSVDLSCAGDLRLIEKPAPVTLPPYGFTTCAAVLRVTATNHGHIFGAISYTGTGALDTETIVLGEVRIDVLEYVQPAVTTDARFRDSWVLLEWENKISIRAPAPRDRSGLPGFLDHIAACGHLTPVTGSGTATATAGAAATGEPPMPAFLACNLYATSIFDEEILANICLEYHQHDDSITGHLRLRSRTQGLAIAYGDKLNALIHGRTQ